MRFPRRSPIYGKRGNAELIVAVDEAAERLGLHAGTSAGAGARHASGVRRRSRKTPGPTRRCLEKIADWCLRYTPLVACDPPDGLTLDISGCAHLYGGEHALVADLGRRVAQAGFTYRIAIAGTIGAAWAAAHFGEPASYAGGEERTLLSPLPLAALRLPSETVAALARVGLKRIGDIVDLPRAPSPPASALSSCVSSTARSAASTSRLIRAYQSRLTSPSSALPSRSRASRTCWAPSRGLPAGLSLPWSGAATAPAGSS